MLICMYECILGIDDVSCSRNEIPESLLALYQKNFFPPQVCRLVGWVGKGGGGGEGRIFSIEI